jgi:competence protein ComFC
MLRPDTLIRPILDFLFPRSCCGCSLRDTSLCPRCLESLPRAREATIGTLRVLPLYHYSSPTVRRMIQRLKYRGDHDIAEILAHELYEHICAELEDLILFENFSQPLLVPIPLSGKRLRERGYNQAERLADKISAVDNGRMLAQTRRVLIKHVDTQPQTRMRSRSERERNIKDCFSVPEPAHVKKRNIILIDDVCTTGTTLNEARRALRRAGARTVIAVTAAH